MASGVVEFAVVGGLREDYFITPSGEVHLREIGGNAVYAAVGARLWSERVGLVARVGANYPEAWLRLFDAFGLDTRGVTRVAEPLDTRTFYAYPSLEERDDGDPGPHFARLGQPVPPELAGYATSTAGQDEREHFGPLAVRPGEVPDDYLAARGVHLAPYDYVVHRRLPAVLRQHGVPWVTADPSVRYMQPAFAAEVPAIVAGLDAFLPSEMEVRSLWPQAPPDLWPAAGALAAMGAACVVVKLGPRGQYVLDAAGGRRWHVPAYPARVRDVTGAGDAYCGGFLVGLARTGDPLEAALCGTAAASLVVEGLGALFALSAPAGEARARRNALRAAVNAV